MRAKKPRRTIRSKHSAGAEEPMPVPSRIKPRALLFVGICVMAVAALIAARQAYRTDDASVSTRTETTAPPENAAMATHLETTEAVVSETTEAVVSKAPATATAAKTSTTNASPVKTPAVKPVKAVALESSPLELTPEAASAEELTRTAAVLDSTTTADVQNVALVTIAGCLELDDATFWLTDTAGGDVPKSRSWKSGFLRKRRSSIQLVDGTQTLKLPTYVGQRVEATGRLVNREMRARSLQPVAAACN
ncbi:MAG: hypothetical protein ACRD1Q_05685 [Vicinamibacterales bacterium]